MEREKDLNAGAAETDKTTASAGGLAQAIIDVIDTLRGHPASGGAGPDHWELIVGLIAKHDSLPDNEVKALEKAIEQAYRGWSDAQRRSIWHETESGMADDEDDDCDTSFDGLGYALQVELLAEVTRAAWRDAEELKREAAKKPRRRIVPPAARKT